MAINPKSHAPFDSPEDYILSWTDLIWDDYGMGRLPEHYAQHMVVHGAYGPIRGVEDVLRGSLVKKSAFPNRVGTAEDVICEERGDDAFISHHRVFHSGPQEGWSTYGPPTLNNSESRNMAICLVRNGLVEEEWVVRDEYRVVTTLGLDPQEIARKVAFTDEAEGLFGTPAPNSAVTAGESGPRPDTHTAEASMIDEFLREVWNKRHLERVPEFTQRDLFLETTRARVRTRPHNYRIDLSQMIAPFPDATIEVRDIAVNTADEQGTRVGVLWRLTGTYDGAPIYGPITRTPVEILGSSQFLLRKGKIIREWRVYDEIAVMAQIARARGDEPTAR
ncbi:ester cyclase [Streptomyces sp. NBC_00006]|uniref:nuclear transport factor 2 family protein n=1 Tax=unclassified Streptomyces TaxID=2593676 RepID=UPI0022508034|nr:MULTISPECIES: ester cyclase [unclassified Streptomyces]MCX5535851.1 ester cyclase [Streptomyces sp. NBC_00006]